MRTMLLSAVVLLVSISCVRAGDAFSSLPAEKQQQIRKMVEPPSADKRYGPYSTPMYYLMYAGYKYEGDEDKGPNDRNYIKDKPGPSFGNWKVDRNRPDWQEAMIEDFAELGLNNTHLDIYPIDNKFDLPPDYLKAIEDYATLSAKHGLKVGVRLDPPGGYVAWEVNPSNPRNQLDAYLTWTKTLATLMKGKTAYYVLGDELRLYEPSEKLPDKAWTTEGYFEYFKKVSAAIKQVDSDAKVSMFAASSGEWFNVLQMLKHGYAEYGDAVAINFYDYGKIPEFFEDARRLAPKLMFLSNGVGYCSNGTITQRYPEGDGYSKLPTEEAHGAAIAKNMFAWWDLGASTAPYYISLRNWVKDGKVYPRWFGFFGFEDYVIENDTLTVKRYPGWHAFQTITHTFYNRKEFTTPSFAVKSASQLTMFRVYEHRTDAGAELLLMMWNDGGKSSDTISIASGDYHYPVQVGLFDYRNWSDVASESSADGLSLKVDVGPEPVIVRLVREK